MSEVEARGEKSQGSGLTARQEYWLGLYRQNQELLRRYFTRHVSSNDDAEALMQTVLLHLIACQGHLENPHAYLSAVARHQLRVYWRRRRGIEVRLPVQNARKMLASSGLRGSAFILSFNALRDALRGRRREEAVQGAGMGGPFQVSGAAESDASVRLGVRSHVPGTRRDRAQADGAGIKKAKP
jgi:DNA-directed RNA polymerase specialized sigma24 family protein